MPIAAGREEAHVGALKVAVRKGEEGHDPGRREVQLERGLLVDLHADAEGAEVGERVREAVAEVQEEGVVQVFEALVVGQERGAVRRVTEGNGVDARHGVVGHAVEKEAHGAEGREGPCEVGVE